MFKFSKLNFNLTHICSHQAEAKSISKHVCKYLSLDQHNSDPGFIEENYACYVVSEP